MSAFAELLLISDWSMLFSMLGLAVSARSGNQCLYWHFQPLGRVIDIPKHPYIDR